MYEFFDILSKRPTQQYINADVRTCTHLYTHVHTRTMPRAWQQRGQSMAHAWPGHGKIMARAWQEHVKSMSTACQQHVESVSSACQEHGNNMGSSISSISIGPAAREAGGQCGRVGRSPSRSVGPARAWPRRRPSSPHVTEIPRFAAKLLCHDPRLPIYMQMHIHMHRKKLIRSYHCVLLDLNLIRGIIV